MTKYIKFTFVIPVLFLSLAFLSCEKEVKLKTKPYQPKLVFNCLFDNRGILKGEVSGSVKALSLDQPKIFNDATVKLYDYLTYMENMNFDVSENKYVNTFKPQYGKTYRVTVEYPGYEGIVGLASLPDSVGMVSKQFVDTAGYDENGAPYSTFTFSFNDNGSQQNYYRLELFYYDNFSNLWMPLNFDSDDIALSEEVAVYLAENDAVFTDGSFNGKQKSIKVRMFGAIAQGSPRFEIRFSHLSADYYKYISKSDSEYDTSPEFFQEPVIVWSNMTHGLGVFAGRTIVSEIIN